MGQRRWGAAGSAMCWGDPGSVLAPATAIYRQEIPGIIKIPPTFMQALVVYKVISVLKEGFDNFFTAPCF